MSSLAFSLFLDLLDETEVRVSTPSKPSGTMDKNRDAVRLSNSSGVQGKEHSLSVTVDGWEKSKMKKKRTAIKPDVTPSSMATKPTEGYRKTKQGIRQGFRLKLV